MFPFNFLNIGGGEFQENVDKRMQKTIVPIFAMGLLLSLKRHDPAMLFTVTAHSKECRKDGILLLERLEGLAAFAAERQSSSRDPA
jgi:hypothetical protein